MINGINYEYICSKPLFHNMLCLKSLKNVLFYSNISK